MTSVTSAGGRERLCDVIQGRMIGGLAMVAHPAEHGISGIITFIMNQEGVVHEKNLGADTAEAVHGMKAFDPDKTSRKAE